VKQPARCGRIRLWPNPLLRDEITWKSSVVGQYRFVADPGARLHESVGVDPVNPAVVHGEYFLDITKRE